MKEQPTLADMQNEDKVSLSQSYYRKLLVETERLEAINAELLAALTGIMPWTTNNSPDWATPEAMNRNRQMYENAFTAAEIAIEKAKGDEENL